MLGQGELGPGFGLARECQEYQVVGLAQGANELLLPDGSTIELIKEDGGAH